MKIQCLKIQTPGSAPARRNYRREPASDVTRRECRMVGNELDSGQGQPRAAGLHQGHRTEGCMWGLMIIGGFACYKWLFQRRAPTICLYDCICHSGAGAGQGN